MESLRNSVITWANSGGGLSAGISLFLTFNRNVLYARNIEVKGEERGTATLVAEFARRLGISDKEIWDMIKGKRYINPAPAPEPPLKKDVKRIRLREEFPFLGATECPEILAVLVNKMLTAYDTYRSNREMLFEVNYSDVGECYRVGRSVLDPYILNRDIWAELNYYKIHGKLLGSMPEFAAINLKKKFEGMPIMKLAGELRSNIPRRMTYLNRQLENETADKELIRTKMADLEMEKVMIRKELSGRGDMP
jgi:hypothetical protein